MIQQPVATSTSRPVLPSGLGMPLAALAAAPVSAPVSGPRVSVLMAVRNGAGALPAQLDSLALQSHGNWHLLVSDDGSSDGSAAILDAFALAHPGRVTCLQGPRRGCAANFLSLVAAAAQREPAGSWIAFCDQDDVWLPDRLARGVAALSLAGPAARTPALYCSRTWITDQALGGRRLSVARPRAPGFANALVQNIASGNTILLNAAAAHLAMEAAAEVCAVVVHDWWIYQLVTGAGGRVVHDDCPTLLYRQHPDNQIGANDTLRAQVRRIRQLLRGDYRLWNTVNLAALRASASRLTPENRRMLDLFDALRTAPLPRRLRHLAQLGLYRQSRSAQAALWLAAMLGRL